MASWLKSVFGGSGDISELPEELQKMLAQAEGERKALTDLLALSEKAQQDLEGVSGPLAVVQASTEAMSQQISELQGRVDLFSDISSQVDSVEQHAKDLTESQSKATTTVDDTLRRVSDLRVQVRDVQSMVNEIVTAKDDVTELAGPYGTVATLLKRVNLLREELQQLQDREAGIKGHFAELDAVEGRIVEIDEYQTELASSLERSSTSVDELKSQVTTLHDQLEAVADARTDMAELLGPKGTVTTVLKQVDVVRDELKEMQDRGTGLKETLTQLDVVEERIEGVSASRDELAGSLQRSSSSVDKLESQVTTLHDQLEAVADARTDMAELVGPKGTVATVLKQVGRLRDELKEMQDRGAGLQETLAQLDVVEKRIEGVSASQHELAGSLEQSSSSADRRESQVTTLHDQVEAVVDARTDMAELLGPKGTVATLLTRVGVLREELKEMQDRGAEFKETLAQLDVVEKRIEGVSASQHELAGSLEQGSSSADELESQVTTLHDQVEAVAEARADMAELLGPKGSVATLLKQVGRVRDELKEMQDRGAGLKEALAQLDIVEKRIEGVSVSQHELAGSLERSSSSADKLEGQATTLHDQVEAVAEARAEMAELLGPQGELSVVREDLGKLKQELGRIEDRTADLDKLEGRMAAIGERADSMTEDQRKGVEAIQSASQEAKEIDAKLSDLHEGMKSVTTARQEISELSGPKGALSKLRRQVEEARAQFLDYSQDVARIREDQADSRSAQEDVLARYEEIRTKMDTLDKGVENATTRVATVEVTLQDLTKAEELASRTERHLNALRALSDHVSQKTASLERQREAIDRTEAQARSLTDLHWELESKLKEARGQVKEVKKVHTSIENLREMNATVAEQSDEIRSGQASIRREDQELRSTLAELQEQVRHSTQSFELGQANLEAIDQRMIDLRTGVTEFEKRFRALDDTSQRISEATRQGDHVVARMMSISSEVDGLSEQVELVAGMREGMARAEASAVEAANRLERIEARQSEVQDAIRDLTTLRGSREEVVNALERLRATRAEIERMQAGQLETGAWLATAQESIRDLRQRITQLDDLTANVDHMRQHADQVMAAASHLEAREPSLTALDNRMSALREIGTQLDERTSNLLGSLADADRRFEAVAV